MRELNGQGQDFIVVKTQSEAETEDKAKQFMVLSPDETFEIVVRHNPVEKQESYVIVNDFEPGTVEVITVSMDKNTNESVINKSIVGYSAVEKNESVGDFEEYENGEEIVFSEEFRNRLKQNGILNYPLFFDIVVSQYDDPVPIQLQVFLPRIIKNVFLNGSFSILDTSNIAHAIREDEDQAVYMQTLSPVTVLETIV